jgi:hypothetical protein
MIVEGKACVMTEEAMQCTSEQLIRSRSYQLWEREGRPAGRSEEYWFRAKNEIEEEMERQWRAIGLEAETVPFVPSRLAISQRPVRNAA